ncbi:unnamed protein product, partial [Rotaria sp. Silwood1]
MGNGLIQVKPGLCEDGCDLTISWLFFGGIFLLTLIGLRRIYHIYRPKQHQRKINQNDKRLPRRKDTIKDFSRAIQTNDQFILPVNPSKRTETHQDVYFLSIAKSSTTCIVGMDIYAIPIDEIDKPINQVFPLIEERKLICYCDGSYSHYMQIGHFGFRASNGAHRIRFFSPRDPKTGSTDTEVLAACLAI